MRLLIVGINWIQTNQKLTKFLKTVLPKKPEVYILKSFISSIFKISLAPKLLEHEPRKLNNPQKGIFYNTHYKCIRENNRKNHIWAEPNSLRFTERNRQGKLPETTSKGLIKEHAG